MSSVQRGSIVLVNEFEKQKYMTTVELIRIADKYLAEETGGNCSNLSRKQAVRAMVYFHQHLLKQCNVSGALPANEDILKAIIKIKPEPLPNRWADDEHINLNYMAGFMTGVKWSYGQGNDR